MLAFVALALVAHGAPAPHSLHSVGPSAVNPCVETRYVVFINNSFKINAGCTLGVAVERGDDLYALADAVVPTEDVASFVLHLPDPHSVLRLAPTPGLCSSLFVPSVLRFNSSPCTPVHHVGTFYVEDAPSTNLAPWRLGASDEYSSLSSHLPRCGVRAPSRAAAAVAAGFALALLGAGLVLRTHLLTRAVQTEGKRASDAPPPARRAAVRQDAPPPLRKTCKVEEEARSDTPAIPAATHSGVPSVTVSAPTTVTTSLVLNFAFGEGGLHAAAHAEGRCLPTTCTTSGQQHSRNQDVDVCPPAPLTAEVAPTLKPTLVASTRDDPCCLVASAGDDPTDPAPPVQGSRAVAEADAEPLPPRVVRKAPLAVSEQSDGSESCASSASASSFSPFILFPRAVRALSAPTGVGGAPGGWECVRGVDTRGRAAPSSVWAMTNKLWTHTVPRSLVPLSSSDSEDGDGRSDGEDAGGEARVWHGNWQRVLNTPRRRRGGVIPTDPAVRRRRAAVLRRIKAETVLVNSRLSEAVAHLARPSRSRVAGGSSSLPSPALAVELPVAPYNPPIIVQCAAVKGDTQANEIVLQRELQSEPQCAGGTVAGNGGALPLPALVVGCSGMKRAVIPSPQHAGVEGDEGVEPQLQPSSAPSAPPSADARRLARYTTMLRVCVPLKAVAAKMRGDGCGQEDVAAVAAGAGQVVPLAAPAPPSVKKPEAPTSTPPSPRAVQSPELLQLSSGATGVRPADGPPRPAGLPVPSRVQAVTGGPPRPPEAGAVTGGPPRPPGAGAVMRGPPRPPGAAVVVVAAPPQGLPRGPVATRAAVAGPAAAALTPPTIPGLDSTMAAGLSALFARQPAQVTAGARPLSLGSPSRGGPSVTTPVSPARVSLIDGRRSQNVAIALARVRNIPPPALCLALLSLAPTVSLPGSDRTVTLTAQQAQLLVGMCPTAEEVQAVQQWARDKADPALAAASQLPETERFFFALSSVPSPIVRAGALAFRLTFPARVAESEGRMALLTRAVEEVGGRADVLVKVLETAKAAVAAAGAWVAVTGTPSDHGLTTLHLPSLKGARLPSLPMRDPRGTVMHYLSAVLDLTDRGCADAVTGVLPDATTAASPSRPSPPGGAPSWKTSPAAKQAPVPSPASVWPACAALASAREAVTSLPGDFAGMTTELGRLVQLAVGQGEAAAAAEEMGAQLRAQKEAFSAVLVRVQALHARLAAPAPPAVPGPGLEALAVALLDFCAALAKARMDMRAHAAAAGM